MTSLLLNSPKNVCVAKKDSPKNFIFPWALAFTNSKRLFNVLVSRPADYDGPIFVMTIILVRYICMCSLIIP